MADSTASSTAGNSSTSGGQEESSSRTVTLISREGDSFEVSVDVARMSELVKTMIDGKPRKCIGMRVHECRRYNNCAVRYRWHVKVQELNIPLGARSERSFFILRQNEKVRLNMHDVTSTNITATVTMYRLVFFH